MSMVKEFKEFAMKGSVVDLAVGVIIGAAFGKIVTALVEKIIMPPIGLLIGGVDFSDLKIILKEAVNGQGEVAIGYGEFIQTAFNFLIIAWAIFMMVKLMNSIKKKEAIAPTTTPPEDILLLREIRDSLRK